MVVFSANNFSQSSRVSGAYLFPCLRAAMNTRPEVWCWLFVWRQSLCPLALSCLPWVHVYLLQGGGRSPKWAESGHILTYTEPAVTSPLCLLVNVCFRRFVLLVELSILCFGQSLSDREEGWPSGAILPGRTKQGLRKWPMSCSSWGGISPRITFTLLLLRGIRTKRLFSD